MHEDYKLLGLNPTASDQEVRKAYKKLATKWHPDKNNSQGAEDHFKAIKRAYENIINSRCGNSYNSHSSFDFEEELRKFHEHQKRQSAKLNRTVTNLTLEQAYSGIRIKHGQDYINVPAGVRSGTKFIVGNNAIEINIRPHQKFKRADDDLLVDVTISAIEAMVGINAIVTTLANTQLKFKIPAGIQHGHVIKLQHQGMPNPELNKRGDLLIRVNITIPVLTDDDKDAIIHLVNRSLIQM